MKKKILTFVLSLLLFVATMPQKIYADNSDIFSNIDISSYLPEDIGYYLSNYDYEKVKNDIPESPKNACLEAINRYFNYKCGPTDRIFNDGKFKLSYIFCRNINDEYYLATDNNYSQPFVVGETYEISLFIQAIEGKWGDIVSFNWDNSQYASNVLPEPKSTQLGYFDLYADYPNKMFDSECTAKNAIMITYEFTMSEKSTETEPIAIDSVNLSNIIPTFSHLVGDSGNTVGEVVDKIKQGISSLENISLPTNSEALSVFFINDGDAVLSSDTEFSSSEEGYRLWILLKADSGYSFGSSSIDEFSVIQPTPTYNEVQTGTVLSKTEDGRPNFTNPDTTSDSYLYIQYYIVPDGGESDAGSIDEIDLSSYINTDLHELDDNDILLQSVYNSLNTVNIPHISLRQISFLEHYFDNDMNNVEVNPDMGSSFDVNKQYLINLFFEADSGYNFPYEFSESTGYNAFSGIVSPAPTMTCVGEIFGYEGNYSVVQSETDINNGICITYDLKCDWDLLNDAIVNFGSKSIDGLFDVSYNENTGVKNIKLLSDFTAQSNSRALEMSSCNLVLDLNGHVLNRNLISSNGTTAFDSKGYGSVLYLNNGSDVNLTISDSNPNAKHDGYIDSAGLWHLSSDGHPTSSEEAKTIYGGIITGGTGSKTSISNYYEGGGIYVLNQTSYGYSSSVTLNGGNICGNCVHYHGGGIALIEEDGYGDSSKLNLTINNANIIYNCALSDNLTNDPQLEYDPDVGGAGLYTFSGKVFINNANICNNKTDFYGGGIFNSDYSEISIIGGSISNNLAKHSGGIYSRNIVGKIKLYGSDDVGVTITGNKSTLDGNVYCSDLSVSGKVVIKNNISEPALMYEDGNPLAYDDSGNVITDFNGDIKKVIKANANDLIFEYIPDLQKLDGLLQVSDVLNNSDINLSILYFVSQTIEEGATITPVVTSDYLNAYADAQSIANAKANDFIHYSGSDIYYLKLIENELCVVDTPIKSATSSNDVTEAISQAADMFDENPESNFVIKISKPSGTEEETDPIVLEEIALPSNTTLDLDGNDVEFKGETIIFGELEDNGETKGKIFMDKPENLIYNSSKEAETEDEKRQMPTWWPDEDGDGGYYYLYELGAQSKWSPVDGVKWQKPGDNVAKFKIQPTIKEIESLQDVYVSGTKLKVGVRVSLVHNNGSDRIIDLTFGNDLIENWSSSENPAKKCVYVQLEGLKNYKSLGADAALYSKPSNKTNIKNSEFHTLYMDASN